MQLKGFSSVRICLWVFKIYTRVHSVAHCEQFNGLSPVRTLSSLFNNSDFLKVLLHLEQLKGFSPVWIPSCTSKFKRIYEFYQYLQCCWFSEGLVTHWVADGFLIYVNSSMNFESTRPGKFYVILRVAKLFLLWKSCHTLSSWMISFLCKFFCESWKYLSVWISYHTFNSKMVSPPYLFFHDSLKYEFLITL